MANHALPTTTSTYTNFVAELSARFNDLALWLDSAYTTPTNTPTNAKRWSSASNKFEKWNGTAWVDLTATYVFPAATFSGNVTLGDASTDTVQVNGYVGVGGAPNSTVGLNILSSGLTGANQYGSIFQPTGTASATSKIVGARTEPATAAAAFTVTDVIGFHATNAVKGAGSTITNQHGVYIADQTQGTNNYGITSLVSSGANKWNVYASGTAQNYFAGNVGIGSTAGYKFDVQDTALTGTTAGGNIVARFRSNSSGADTTISISDGVTYSAQIGQVGGNYFVRTGGTERLRIDSLGRVGIGTPSPTSALDVVGDAEFTGNVTSNGLDFTAISQSLHSGAIVKQIVYDTSKDSDGGAWCKRTAHTSWYQETLGFTGKWLGQKTSTATAWAASGAAAGDGFQNTTDGKYYVLTGTSTASEIFRGNVRGFPAVVAVVAEAARVVIYDLTQPACPMWMVFKNMNTIGGGLWASYSASSVAMLNGLLCIPAPEGGSVENLRTINFVSDSAFTYCANASYYSTYAPRNGYWRWGIARRMDTSVTNSGAPTTTPTIVSAVVNDCAITVLDTAPIDPATGLPVPTIYACTAVGVSRIAHDGAVSSTATSTPVSQGWIDGDYVRALGATGTVACAYPLAATLPTGGGQHLHAYWTTGIYSSATIPPLNVNTNGKGVRSTFGANTGVFVVKENPATPAKGMVDYITNTYNSGWMVGDIRLAALADTTVETISGSGELVTNGTFTTDTSGWTASANATLSVVSGELQVASSAGGSAWGYQAITVVPGRTYSLTFTQRRGTATGSRVFVGSAVNGFELGQVTNSSTSATPGVISFTPSTTTVYLHLQTDYASGNSLFDNISVKLAEPDRCVKNKGLIVNGSLTKTAVASAAALVAYSGFSAFTNYLEQPYNPDLDVGTGDFFAMGWANPTSHPGSATSLIDRSDATSSTPRWRVGFTATAGCPDITLVTSGGNFSATGGAAAPIGQYSFLAFVKSGPLLLTYMNGVQVASTNAAAATTLTNTIARLRVGVNAVDGASAFSGSMALWRIGATAPSADQIAHIYRTELPLFQAGAQCTLAGTSAAVTTLAYDDVTDLLHVGTSWGRSAFKGLARIESEATTTGSITSISASGGVVLTGGTSAKVYMPALLLRDELKRSDEAKAALGKDVVPHWYTAAANQTVFALPKGFSIKAVYVGGGFKRPEGHDYTASYDGFVWSITLLDACTAGDNVCIMGVYNG